MLLNFKLPAEYEAALTPALGEEEILYCVPFDLDASSDFTEGYFVIGSARLFVLQKGLIAKSIPIRAISNPFAVELNSAGYLECEVDSIAMPIVRYSMEHLARYAMVQRILEEIIETGSAHQKSIDDEKKCKTCGRAFLRNTTICPHCSDRMGIFKRLWDLTKNCRRLYVILLGLFWLNSLIMLASPAIQKHLINDVINSPSGTIKMLIIFIALTALCSIASTLVGVFRQIASTRASNMLVRTLRDEVYSKIQSMGLGYLEDKKTGDLMQRINGDTGRIQRFIQNIAVQALNEIMLFLGVAIMLFYYNWRMAILILIPAPFVAIIINRIRTNIRRRYHIQWRKMDRLTSVLNDVLNGIRVVKAFGQEQYEIGRFGEAARNVRDVTTKNEKYFYTIFPFVRFLVGFGSYFVLLYGGSLVIGKEMGLGELMQFSTYAGYLYNRMEWFSFLPRHVSEAVTSAQRVFEIMDEQGEAAAHSDADADKIQGNVEFSHVTFGYKSYKSVIKDFSLNVKKGEMIGLVGHSGAGKSTIINLLMRLYDTDEGEILIDGHDVRDYDRSAYKSKLGVVLQESYLFSGSILANICYARPGASVNDVIRAAKMANAHDFIMNLPNAYDTYVGERGHRLSGGERQRISIARAILSDPVILILDEATASVDTETESRIQSALARLTSGRTTFAIAHRLSTLKNADRLVVLEEGRLAETGTHDELMKKNGIYASLVRAQRTMSAIAINADEGGGPRRGHRGGPPSPR
ncbi:MAG: ABC transporter ATP-binding protein [Clostridia bacterium]|nr:ABC transporter ATP-binding protein [Clostridia bacterium]